jgi:hypothetical protein
MVCILIVVVACWAGPVQSSGDHTEIEARALDYIEGWYEGNVERMTRALHPEFVKKGIHRHPDTGKSNFGLHSATTLIEATRRGRGRKYAKESRRIEITILDVGRDMANVRITCGLTREYLQMVRFDGHWKVLHVLFEFL